MTLTLFASVILFGLWIERYILVYPSFYSGAETVPFGWQEIGTALFERLGTRISLTPAGRIFADYAEQILDLRRRSQDAINELERTPRGELLIAANESTCIYVLPGVFSQFKLEPNAWIARERQ